jgi:TolB-like protein
MRTTSLPARAGMDRPSNELACRRLMSSLFKDKAEAVATLLHHSAELEDTRAVGALSDAAFESFMAAAHHRADAIRALDEGTKKARRFPPALGQNPWAWGLAAAALIALAILARGVFDGFAGKEKDSSVSATDTSFQTASDSTRVANVRPMISAASPQNPAITAQPIQIAVPSFIVATPANQALGGTFAQMIAENLAGSGSFTIVDTASYATVSDLDALPAFLDGHQINARALVAGRVVESANGFEIAVHLWDVSARKQLSEQQYTTGPEKLRDTAARIAEMVREQIIGTGK